MSEQFTAAGVSSGRFTDEAISFAGGRNVTLVDGPKLHGLLRQAQVGADRPPAQKTAVPITHAPPPPSQALACPLCAKPVVRRTAKRGANAGNEFWGCTGYPACRGPRPIN